MLSLDDNSNYSAHLPTTEEGVIMSYSSEFPPNYPFQPLIGTWTNQNLSGSMYGGEENPLSYSLMPLPQDTPQPGEPDYGYILKNFTCYETIHFNDQSAITPPGHRPKPRRPSYPEPFCPVLRSASPLRRRPGCETDRACRKRCLVISLYRLAADCPLRLKRR
jgi:hypothetical protein